MGSNEATITISNYTGNGMSETVPAAIDDTLIGNAISGNFFDGIRGKLKVTPLELGVAKTLVGSGGVGYTARRKVCLSAKAAEGWGSDNLDFHIIDALEKHKIILGKGSAGRLFLNDTSGHVAPIYWDKGNDPGKFDREAEERARAGREKAKQADAESERIKKEQSAKQGQSGSNNQPK